MPAIGASAASHTLADSWIKRLALVAFGLLIALTIAATNPARAAAACANPVACENQLPGDPESDWQPGVPDDPAIEGFATSMGINAGQTESFKIKTVSTRYHIDILRLGYYGGDGARLVTRITPSATLPQTQPACDTNTTTGLVDCGNWAVSASWAVPSTAVSGVYVAHLVRDDHAAVAGESSHIVFVVRNDASHSDIVVQTSDETWEAYNDYGGQSLYSCTTLCPAGNPGGYKGAFAVSYNRPFSVSPDDAFGHQETEVFWAEYPMIRFMEANGYDVSYVSGSDVDRDSSLLLNHKLFVSSGHDEYWSGAQRANVTAARNAGVSLAFFSGNEVFWKTRWQASIDGSNTPYRTLVSYKETHFNAPTDPDDPPTWTGTWRDPRFSPPGDGDQPENSLTGQYDMVDAGTADITVPSQYSKLRFWRNTQVAGLQTGQTLTLAPDTGTLGFEWDVDADNGFRPAGLFDMSKTTVSGVNAFYNDYGTTEETNTTATHSLTLYRAPSGALVFGAGTIQWSWGLDGDNNAGNPADPNMQQATVNLFADMGIQPTTLEAGLVPATKSTDTTAPTSSIASPTNGATISDGNVVTVTGSATDNGGGVVAGVEVSTDGGTTWHPATPASGANTTVNWSYSWTAHGYPQTRVETRAVDDSGNLETSSDAITVNITCPCSIWGTHVTPPTPDSGDATPVEVGVKFTTDSPVEITGLRFYKAAANTGTHVGDLWTASGTKLGSATFTNETASGWQTVTFATPVAISPGQTYIASYLAPHGHYAGTSGYFYPPPSPPGLGGGTVDSGPLHAVRNTGANTNGVYAISTTSAFPTNTFGAANYWVDPVFAHLDAPGPVTSASATASFKGATVTWSAPSSGGPATSYIVTPYIGSTAQTPMTVSPPATSATFTGLTAGSTYTFTVQASNGTGNAAPSPPSNAVTIAVQDSIFDFGTPAVIDSGDTNGVNLGVKFTSDTEGSIVGIRFYKATANTGTHIGSLWTLTGQLLGQATFTSETVSGWQQVSFSNPVYITPGTTYVASYFAPNGHYSATLSAFSSPFDNPPLHAVANGVSADGVYSYGTVSGFPTSTYQAQNYWVDVLYAPPVPPPAPSNVTATAQINGAHVSWTAPTAGPIDGYTITPYIGSTAQTPTNAPASATSADVTGLTPGTSYTFTVQASNTAGSGPASGQSNAVTVKSPTAPDAPTQVVANPATNQALVAWATPNSNGSPITGYTITPYLGSTAGTAVQVGASATSAKLTGLTNGSAYKFTVIATNVVGSSAESAQSAAVTPEDTIFDFQGSPTIVDSGDTAGVELGVKFVADTDGLVTGIRFYKSAANTGAHIGSVWTIGGQRLAQATFNNETASGWQTVTFSSPVPVTAGTTYVASYFAPNGHYSSTVNGLSSDITNAPLHALAAGGNDGVFSYGSTSTFPTSSYQSSNYWVDLLFASATTPGTPTGVTATAQTGGASVSWSAPANGPVTSYIITPHAGSTTLPAKTISGAPAPTSTAITGLTAGTSYTFTVQASNSAGTGSASAASNAVVPTAAPPSAPQSVSATAATSQAQVTWAAPTNTNGSPISSYTITPYIGSAAQSPVQVNNGSATSAIVTGLTNGSAYTFTVHATNSAGSGPESSASNSTMPDDTIYDFTRTPATVDSGDSQAIELGLKFTADVNGSITGIRFYKAPTNIGTHTASLWTAGGTRLAQATFTNETASGWQEVDFSAPVAITAGTTYVASYFAPNGHYSSTVADLSAGIDNAPLHAVPNSSSTNGLYAYSAASAFPFNGFNATSYWVDVIFKPS